MSQTNNLKRLIKSDAGRDEETLDSDEFNFSVNNLNLNDESCLSMNFGKICCFFINKLFLYKLNINITCFLK
jgi:hypothetical protein